MNVAAVVLAAMLIVLAVSCGGSTNRPVVTFDALDSGDDPDLIGDASLDNTGPGGDNERDSIVPPDLVDDPGSPPPDSFDDQNIATDPGTDVPGCKDSSTCALGNICFDSQCVPGCGSDRDCAGGLHCKPESLPHGFCVQCISNDHCDVAGGEKCVAGACIMTCLTNDDCADQADAPFCNSTSGTCVQCLSDGVCPIGTLCLAGTCQSGCRSDRDCPDSLKCDPKSGANGGCFTCVQDPDCNGRICREHQCVIDCSVVKCIAERPICDPLNGGCVQCLVKTDCPVGNLCLGNRCIEGCEVDRDCSGGRKCSGGTCVQCITDNQCPVQQKCLQNQCLSAECARDGDCGGGKYCHPLLLSCETLPAKHCVLDSDCPAGYPPIIPAQMCDPLTRECIPSCDGSLGISLCFDLLGGSTRVVCVDNGCYDCGTDNDCSGTRCDPYDRHCLVCSADTDCSVPTWHCDAAGGTCKECLNDKQCAFPMVCDELNGNRCVECLQDIDCKTPGKPICGKSKVCIAPCQNECSARNTVCNPDDAIAPIGFLTCGDYDDDPCLEYGNATECGSGSSCTTQISGLGKCVCQNECSSGFKRCDAGAADQFDTCVQNSTSGCWYWSTGYCGSGEVCISGACECENACTLGAKACDSQYADQVLLCDTDPNDYYAVCPYWQYSTICSTGYVCKGKGVCQLP
jgi:hypothetical protein